MMNGIPFYLLSFLLAFNSFFRDDKLAQNPLPVIPDLFRNLTMPINKHIWAQGSREILKQVQNDGLCGVGISHSMCENKSACIFKDPLDDLAEFNTRYKDEIKNASFHYNEVRSDICSQSARFKTDSLIISAIVFPELIRYSIYRDFMETTVMEYLYVEYGPKASDFSIGMFQIKPSFAELLENEVQNYDGLKKYSVITNYKSSDIKETRKERIERLGSSLWQIIYMNCFYSLMELKFKNVAFADIKDKIRFYATCYNLGFNCSNDEILKWTTRKTFPHGYNSTRKNYCYGDISLMFYYMLKTG